MSSETKSDVAQKQAFLPKESSDSDSSLESLDNEPLSDRVTWDRRIEYLLSLFGYSVGLGNLWRFPYLCVRNGGGAFLVPFFFFLITCGIPLYLLEVSLGQFSGKSPLIVWSVAPFFKGLGLLMVIISGIVSWYYNTVIAWVLYYLVHAFFPSIPWATCDNWWNTENCITDRKTLRRNNQSAVVSFNTSLLNTTESVPLAGNASQAEITYNTAAFEFWEYNVLNKSSGFDDIGGIQWHLVAVMAGAWLFTFLCLIKGVHSVGKVVYVTVTLPYILLTVILVRGLTLDGSIDGIIYYLKPDFRSIFKFQAWMDAANQVFFSLGPAWGGLITMSSYNKFHSKVFRDAIYGTLVDGMTSFYAGFVVFSILGYMAKQAGLTIEKISLIGPGLVFIAYPEALVTMPLPHLWGVLFFIMLLTVGIDSQFGMFETLSSGLVDAFPRQLGKRKILTTATLCASLFILSLPFTTRGGNYIFQLVDWYASSICILLGSCLECIVVAWIYGAERFSRDIEMMTGRSVGRIVRFAWCILTPFIMFVTLVTAIWGMSPPNNKTYTYPDYARIIGLIFAFIPCLPVPVVMVYGIIKSKETTFYKKISTLLRPDDSWRPNHKQHAQIYKVYEYTGSFITNLRINLLGVRERKNEHISMIDKNTNKPYTDKC